MERDDGLYLVLTNPVMGYAACAEAAVRARLHFVQLRMKDGDDARLLRTASEVRAVTRGSETHFIVNDSAELAARVGADGVHLGQDDEPVLQARQRFPELRYFGLSTHSLSQMRQAVAQRPDYIGVGPFFGTPTKPDYPPLGLDAAAAIVAESALPAVAIGGINAENLPLLIRAGVRNFAVVRAVCLSRNPYDAIRRLQAIATCGRDEARGAKICTGGRAI
jgi:thiamine-phosphate pyrophosphorylase